MTIIQIIGFLEQRNKEKKELIAKEMIWKKSQNWKAWFSRLSIQMSKKHHR